MGILGLLFFLCIGVPEAAGKSADRWEQLFGMEESIQCSVYGQDGSGFESCGQCLEESFSCQEICHRLSFACTAEGRASNGRLRRFEGYSGQSGDEAGLRAMEKCQRSGARGCVLRACSARAELVSEKICAPDS